MITPFENEPFGGDHGDLAELFLRLGRELTTQHSVDDVLHLVSHRAYELVPSAERAAVTRGVNGGAETTAAVGGDLADPDDVRSQLSVRIFLEDDTLQAGLSLYSTKSDAFDQSDRTTATLLATHAALALAAARRQSKIENLERALQTSRRIGTAMGILMASYKVTEHQAFDLLRIASQSHHRKLHDIADDVVQSGSLDLPDPPEERRRS
jgi:hypothetical protein